MKRNKGKYEEVRWQREVAKREKRERKYARRKRLRDEKVTKEGGTKAHGECGRKDAYTKPKAFERADALSRSHLERFEPYKCPWCGQWHLTSHPRKGSGNEEATRRD